MQGKFEILEGTPSHVQKVLNQWRHQFLLIIHGFQVVTEHIYVLVERQELLYGKKEEE